MATQSHHSPNRYGCQECRDDQEHVLSNRATPEVRALYDEHLRACRHCRRTHRVLYALYEGPVAPAPPVGVAEEKEFHAILRRMKADAPQPWYHKLTVRGGIAVLATSAAALTLSLFNITPSSLGWGNQDAADGSGPLAALESPEASGDVDGSLGETLSIRHSAQAYGRVVGGSATVRVAGGEPTTSNTFGVGTSFEVSTTESLQVGLVGKMVANFTPGSKATWRTGSPSLVEIQLDEGMLAVRYDRDMSDPILQIRTPSSVVRVVGTVFTVQVDPTEGTAVSVLRGAVEVINPENNRSVAEVPSGNRYLVEESTYAQVGRLEVQSALPISRDAGLGGDVLAASIPSTWNVPGLTAEGSNRTLAAVPERGGEDLVVINGPSIRVMGTTGPSSAPAPEPALAPKPRAQRVESDGDDLVRDLMRGAADARRQELKASLTACKDLYSSNETRYLAAKCIGKFLAKYDDHPLAAEAYLLRGVLRMDYALDHKAAEVDLRTYLRRAPKGRQAETATYRLWLAATESGRINDALKRARAYLDRYPNGRFVGKIIQRFPELKREL